MSFLFPQITVGQVSEFTGTVDSFFDDFDEKGPGAVADDLDIGKLKHYYYLHIVCF